MALQDITGKLAGLLTGEPLRVITYGAAVTVWLATHIAKAANIGNLDAVDFDGALAAATAAAVAVTELGRRFVYSPNTVAAIAAVSAATGTAVVPPPPAAADTVADAVTDAVEAVAADAGAVEGIVPEDGAGAEIEGHG